MTEAMLKAVAGQFRALGEPTRLRLLQALRAGRLDVGELAKAAGLSHANASKHLLVLARAGFVTRREEGTRSIYALADTTTETLCALMCDRVGRHVAAEMQRLRLG
jgi:DNA-binding transcriptional ArsR family regulator